MCSLIVSPLHFNVNLEECRFFGGLLLMCFGRRTHRRARLQLRSTSNASSTTCLGCAGAPGHVPKLSDPRRLPSEPTEELDMIRSL